MSFSRYKSESLLAYFIIFSTGLSYFLTIIFYAQNVPAYDDYIDVIPVIVELSKSPTTTDTIKLIFEQYNQHIIAVNRILYTGIYYLTGQVNFYTLTLFGNLNILIIALLFNSHSSGPHKLLLSSCCCALLFQLSSHHTAMWPMASIANYSVICLSLLTVTLLHKSFPGAFFLAVLSAFFTTFSLGSGQGVLLVGSCMLALQCWRNEPTAKIKLLAWICFSALTLLLFYTQLDISALHRAPPGSTETVPLDISTLLLSFLVLTGAPLAFNSSTAAIVIGAMLIGIFIYCFTKITRPSEPIFAFALFLLASIGILSISRSWIGLDLLVVTERYRIVPICFIACLLLLIPYVFPKVKSGTYSTLALITLLYSVIAFVTEIKSVQEYSKQSIRGISHWIETGRHGELRRPVWVDLKIPFENLKTLYDQGIYNPDLNNIKISTSTEKAAKNHE